MLTPDRSHGDDDGRDHQVSEKTKKRLGGAQNDSEFVADLARYAEGIISEADVKKKYRFDDKTWERLGRDEELVESIQDERVRRVRSGACKREKAQHYVVRAPDVMNDIMTTLSA